ncbi:hypothetical protein C8R44DRAFT_750918 [Mycena epipterygia]|nr:hypothetical protein C8R44DRAFT_750918 [Mycena epipterygia]
MPHQPTDAENHVNNIVACLAPTVTLLQELTHVFGTPFLQAMASTTPSLITAVQCLKVFQVETGLIIANNMVEIQNKTERMHQELLEIAGHFSTGSDSDTSSSIYQSTTSSTSSLNSFSLLPAQPKIFHGRQSEIEDIVTSLIQQSAHIAIRGAGGIGKTSLAKAALHRPQVAAKYEHRFFVATDSATTSLELAVLVRSQLQLKLRKDLAKALFLEVYHASWEPLESRAQVEEFLSLLTEVPQLALMITMQGAERPGKVCWTWPFLDPLKPLSDDAAQQTFIEIADDFHNSKDIDQLLGLTDNLPLAVDLIANLVDYEGCSNVLASWETAKTSLLSTGYDKQSSLDASIMMSLASPRMTPGAKDLLSLLSILPDGLSDIELLQSDLPIGDLLGCRATLLRTSLAYSDDTKRLKSLVPIREHIQSFSPPSLSLWHPLYTYLCSIMDQCEKYRGVDQNKTRVNQITSNIGNLNQLLLQELHPDNPNLADAIHHTISLDIISRNTAHGYTALMDHIPSVFPQPSYISARLMGLDQHLISNPETLIQQGMDHFQHFNDPSLEFKFYTGVGKYHRYHKNDIPAAAHCFERAYSLAKLSGKPMLQVGALEPMAWLKYCSGDYAAAQLHAREAQGLARLCANLAQEASALRIEVTCLKALGILKDIVLLCQRGRELLLCGLERDLINYDLMISLAAVHALKSEYLEARSIELELSHKVSAEKEPFYYAYAALNIAEIDIVIGADVLQVHQNLDSAKRIFTTLGFIREINHCEVIFASLCIREGNTVAAKDLLQQCLQTASGKDHQTMSYCLEQLADIDSQTSTNWAVIYLVHAHKTHEKLALYKALCCIGDVFLCEGNEYTAHNLFVVALEGFTYMDVHCSRANCMLRLGDIAKQKGDKVNAVDLWKEARPLFERSSQAKDVACIDTRLALVEQQISESDTHQKSLVVLGELEAPTMSVDDLETASTVNPPNVQVEEAVHENEGKTLVYLSAK